nr:unnamed protein product [Digitaria exilis]
MIDIAINIRACYVKVEDDGCGITRDELVLLGEKYTIISSFIFAVVVRELFYNQPVRRKQIQSSEKRELHHVKKCVLQIALVHPHISLRLLDIDSEDELLCTSSLPSPLSLISKNFGDDISRCLHEIAASDQGWVLSGRISGPVDVVHAKEFQYLCILLASSPLSTFIYSFSNSWKHP